MTKVQQNAVADRLISRITDMEMERRAIREYLDAAGVPAFDGDVQYPLSTRVWWLCELAAAALAEYQSARDMETRP